MGIEIERKFLVLNDAYRKKSKPIYIKQGFLSTQKERVVRVRIADEKALLAIKGKTNNISRSEFEYEIPFEDADFMLNELCILPLIIKNRYRIPMGSFVWEVDEFFGENKGLVIAEIELEQEEQDFPIPIWLGEEVTKDSKYYNSNLIKNPFSKWV